MALDPEVAAAYEALDAAIQRIDTLVGDGEGDTYIQGYVVIVSTSTFDSDAEDEFDQINHFRSYVKRGQLPVVSRGMIECYLDQYRVAG